MTLDTYDVVRELRAAGFAEAQADALSRLFKRVQDVDLSDFATKADIGGIDVQIDGRFQTLGSKIELSQSQLETKLETVKGQLETKMESIRAETVRWVVGLVSLQTLVIVGTVVTLVRSVARP